MSLSGSDEPSISSRIAKWFGGGKSPQQKIGEEAFVDPLVETYQACASAVQMDNYASSWDLHGGSQFRLQRPVGFALLAAAGLRALPAGRTVAWDATRIAVSIPLRARGTGGATEWCRKESATEVDPVALSTVRAPKAHRMADWSTL
jgi:hypothetical protein